MISRSPCLDFKPVSWYNFATEVGAMDKKNIKSKRKAALIALVVIFAVSAAAELIINAGREGTADVYVQIRCDEVSEAPEKLTDQALVGYIPEDGVAMARLKYIANEGDSVLEILEKICKNNNIEMKETEDGHIDAIGNLKTGDCGEGSGWVYLVNGKQRSEKPADCKVTDGDEIVWAFTLDGRKGIENV